MSTRRLLNIYRKSKALKVYSEGLNWYGEAHKFALHLASVYGVPVEKCAGIISALSPQVTWEVNKKDAEILIAGLSAHINVNEQYKAHRFSTYSKNVLKAEQIFYTENPVVDFFSEKTGAKTLAFFLNILHPAKQTRVTIDRHAIAAWEGDGERGSRAVHAALYKKIENDYIKAAKKVGIMPHDFQAVIWVTYKTINQI
jgi:hypothetical protein